MERRVIPMRDAIGIGAVLEQKLEALIVMPVGLAEQHGCKAVVRELPALDQDLEGGVVEAFRRVIRSLAVVRIRSTLEQQARELRVVSDSGGAVDRALECGLGLVVLSIEPGTRARPGVEQSPRRPHERVRTDAIEPEVSRETQVSQCVPLARAALRGGVCPIES